MLFEQIMDALVACAVKGKIFENLGRALEGSDGPQLQRGKCNVMCDSTSHCPCLWMPFGFLGITAKNKNGIVMNHIHLTVTGTIPLYQLRTSSNSFFVQLPFLSGSTPQNG